VFDFFVCLSATFDYEMRLIDLVGVTPTTQDQEGVYIWSTLIPHAYNRPLALEKFFYLDGMTYICIK
jgi:hypothetical protein